MATAKSSTKAKAPATAKASTAKAAVKPRSKVPAPPKPKVVSGPKIVSDGEKINTNTFIDRVCERSGMKRKDVKPVVEAMLAEMQTALLKSEHLNLQPMGKVMVKREKDIDGARVLNCKIRVNNPD